MLGDPYDKPEYTRSHFPTGARARDFEKQFGNLDEWEVHPDGNTYCICKKNVGFAGVSHTLHLKEGGKTKSVKFERIPIPQPKVKVGIKVRWNENKHVWEKLLSTGWKTIY
jgi:hypothetical protein